MQRFLMVLIAVWVLVSPASAQSAPTAYIPVDQLRDELASFTLDPSLFRPPGFTKPPSPSPPTTMPPQPWLSLAIPYAIETSDVPFVLPETTPAEAGDWRHVSLRNAPDSIWSALSGEDPIALRKRYRADTKRDWPTTADIGPRGDAVRLAVARWAREQDANRVRDAATAFRKTTGARGPLVVLGPQSLWTTSIPANALLNHPGIVLKPRVTNDARATMMAAGFLVRLTADLTQRIPFVSLDLSAYTNTSPDWASCWIAEIARQGVAGIHVTLPREPAVRNDVMKVLYPLRRANVYLPPPSEIGILVSLDTCDLEAGAWLAVFDAYSALREIGLTPGFVSDAQILDGSTSLARYRVLVVPAARWADRGVMDAIQAWVRHGGTLVICDNYAFTRDRDGINTSARAQALMGRAITAPVNITQSNCPWPHFWSDIAKSAGIADRSAYGTLSTQDIRRITGNALVRK